MSNQPLAERVRPQGLDSFTGQLHLTGPDGPIRKYIESGNIPSMIFWGPPGVGKTTLARIIGKQTGLPYLETSAISAGVADIRKIITESIEKGKILLFLDEIHRFNKAQQDALLGAVEAGNIVLIGATTENPSFEVNNALLSRCQVYILNGLDKSELDELINRALREDPVLKDKNLQVDETEALISFSGGDGRKLLNILEMIAGKEESGTVINNEIVMNLLQSRSIMYDKTGEEHYNLISAFIKSLRGSDPNAAVYYLARILEGGEKPEFIARRMIILASEDIGNANPTALILANSTLQTVHSIGMPEARIILSQCAIYLACSPKSNAAYKAIGAAQEFVKKTGALNVPLQLRNPVSGLMKDSGYGQNYQYAHDFPMNFVDMEFMPESIKGVKFFEPGKNPREEEMRKFLSNRWKDKYGY